MKTSGYRICNRFAGLLIAVGFGYLRSLSAGAADIGIGPYLQDVARDAVTVIWWTDFASVGHTNCVEYGDGLTNRQAAVETNEPSFSDYPFHYKQEARLAGLQADTVYSYRVRSDNGANTHTSLVFNFRTAPARSTNIHFAVLGDGQSDDTSSILRHTMIFSNALAYGASFVLYHGDMAMYGSGTTPAADRYWGIFLTNVLCTGNGQTGSGAGSRIPVYMTVGNHEIYRSGGGYAGGNLTSSMARFKAVSANPDNGSTNANWNERYYAFAYGPCYFICLDAINTSSPLYDNHDTLNAGDTPDWEPGSEQYQWMLGRLEYARTNAVFTFVFFHPAPYSRGIHGTDSKAIDGQRGYELRVLDPVFRSYGVDGVFNGHDHIVERCVTGPAGYQTNYPGGLTNELAWKDAGNLNYFIHSNIHDARDAQAGWTNWMSIASNGAAPFYTAYYYDWGGTTNLYASFGDVDIAYVPTNAKWRATFRVIRTDMAGTLATNDAFYIERTDPLPVTPPPSAPTSINASKGAYTDKVRVTWNESSGATGYRIYRHATTDSSAADPIGTAASTAYDDLGALADTVYYYWAKATNSGGTSGFSAYDFGYRAALPSPTNYLPPPTGVSASDGTYTDKVRVTWTPVADAGLYEVWRNTSNSSSTATTLGTTTNLTYDDTHVTANATGFYWVRARTPIAVSEFSLPDVGYAAPDAAAGSADLAALNLVFLPGLFGVGDRPGAAALTLLNNGPDSVIAPNARVRIDFYLSVNSTSGDADDIWFGNYSGDLTLEANSYRTLPLNAATRQDLTVTAVPTGAYNLFAIVRHENPSMLADPDRSNNSAMRVGTVSVTSSGTGPGYHLANDYDDDGKSDAAFYKEATGEWLVLLSGTSYAPNRFVFGGPGYRPALADYDGDERDDPAIYNRNTGEWKAMLSSAGYSTTAFGFGQPTDTPAPSDYDGDGLADPAIYRQSGTWIILPSDSSYAAQILTLGGGAYAPAPADYDGDGKADLAIYRPSTGDWTMALSTLNYGTTVFLFGEPGAIPVPADYDGDGKADPAIYLESSGDWSVLLSRFDYQTAGATFGGRGWMPVAGDYDGDGKADLAVYNADQRLLKALASGSSYAMTTLDVGGPGYEPVSR